MRAVRVLVPGLFWDSQMYAGRLYLFGRDGSMTGIDWDAAIEAWTISEDLRLAMDCAVRRSDYLYGNHWKPMFHDPDIKAVIRAKFERLADSDWVLSPDLLRRHTIGRQESPFPFPHADSTVYSQNMYAVCTAGVFRATCNKRTAYPVGSRAEKISGVPGLALSANYGTLAQLPTRSPSKALQSRRMTLLDSPAVMDLLAGVVG